MDENELEKVLDKHKNRWSLPFADMPYTSKIDSPIDVVLFNGEAYYCNIP